MLVIKSEQEFLSPSRPLPPSSFAWFLGASPDIALVFSLCDIDWFDKKIMMEVLITSGSPDTPSSFDRESIYFSIVTSSHH